MTINLADNTPRIEYSVAQGVVQTVFAVPFEFFDNGDLTVYVDGVPKYEGSDFSISGGDGSTGSITFNTAVPPEVQQVTGAVGGSTVVIVRDIAIERTTDFTSNAINRAALNTQLDTIIGMIADLDDKASRTLQISDYEVAPNISLPSIEDRAGRVIAFDGSGNVAAGPTSYNIDVVASNIAEILQADDNAAAAAASAAAALVSETNAFNSANAASASEIAAEVSETAALASEVNAATSEENAALSEAAAAASEAAAAASEAAAALSESAAAASEAASASSEAAAAASEAAAAISETAAAASASSASASETAAAASEASAAISETNAATSETNAAASETAAATSETNAASSATAAASSASAAASSATSAAGSASAANTSASAASASQTAAAASAVNASTSESNAATSASNASTSEANAATSAATATTQAGNSATSASQAAASASQAATSASNASTSASNAATSATSASSSATAAASSASSASASADAALAALDSFDDRYLGQKTSDPSLDNDGNALVAGALYFNTTDNSMKVYDGSSWLSAYASLSGALLSTNNLSDLSSVVSARTNLGLGTAAVTASTDYATSAQGALADSALQSSDIGVSVQGYNANTVVDSSYVHTDNNYTTTEKNKLAGIEAGATADQTAAEILTAIKTVDGDGSGLDADTLDGNHASAFLTGNQTITLSGDLSGSGTTLINAQLAANVVGANELNVVGNGTTAQYLRSDGDGSFTWATPTDTNTTYSAGGGLTLAGTVFSHTDTSAQASVNNSGATFIQDVTLDTYGHVTGLASATITASGIGALASSNPVISSGTLTEDVYAISGTAVALEPDNGSVQTHTLSGNTTYTDAFSSGQAITLMIDDGSARTITWPTMTWVNNGGSAPTLATTGYTVVSLWKVGATLYGALVGDGS